MQTSKCRLLCLECRPKKLQIIYTHTHFNLSIKSINHLLVAMMSDVFNNFVYKCALFIIIQVFDHPFKSPRRHWHTQSSADSPNSFSSSTTVGASSKSTASSSSISSSPFSSQRKSRQHQQQQQHDSSPLYNICQPGVPQTKGTHSRKKSVGDSIRSKASSSCISSERGRGHQVDKSHFLSGLSLDPITNSDNDAVQELTLVPPDMSIFSNACPLCCEKFSSKGDLREHRINVHDFATCVHCGMLFPSQGAMKNHIKREHHPKYVCEVCNKTFHCRINYTGHMNMHTGTKPYACQFCFKPFAYQQSKYAHEKVCNNTRPLSWEEKQNLREKQNYKLQGKMIYKC